MSRRSLASIQSYSGDRIGGEVPWQKLLCVEVGEHPVWSFSEVVLPRTPFATSTPDR